MKYGGRGEAGGGGWEGGQTDLPQKKLPSKSPAQNTLLYCNMTRGSYNMHGDDIVAFFVKASSVFLLFIFL